MSKLENIASECVKCGRCLSPCPIYKEMNDEIYSSRGRIALFDLLSDEAFRTSKLKDSIDKCLLCLRCRGVCEKNTDYLEGISIIRSKSLKKSYINSFINKIMLNMDIITTISRLLPKPIFNIFAKHYSDDSFFYLKIIRTPISRIMPNYYTKPEYIKKKISYKNDEAKPYLYFPGCGSNLLLPSIANDTISLFRKLHIPFIMPKDMACCGFPLYYNGFEKKAMEIRSKTLKIFSNTHHKKIITTCPTCRTSLIKWYGIDEDKVLDISDILIDKRENFLQSLDNIIYYHKPCHFNGDSPVKTPENLLNSINPNTFVNNNCCGGGGSFFIKNNKLSLSILNKTIDQFSKASNIISSCPLCMLRLADGLYRNKKDLSVRHLASYFLSACSKEN